MTKKVQGIAGVLSLRLCMSAGSVVESLHIAKLNNAPLKLLLGTLLSAEGAPNSLCVTQHS